MFAYQSAFGAVLAAVSHYVVFVLSVSSLYLLFSQIVFACRQLCSWQEKVIEISKLNLNKICTQNRVHLKPMSDGRFYRAIL